MLEHKGGSTEERKVLCTGCFYKLGGKVGWLSEKGRLAEFSVLVSDDFLFWLSGLVTLFGLCCGGKLAARSLPLPQEGWLNVDQLRIQVSSLSRHVEGGKIATSVFLSY